MDENFLKELAELSEKSSLIDPELFDKFNVKRGLRNKDHSGVLVGLTNIGDVIGYDVVEGKPVPAHGNLLYRGISIKKLVDGFQKDKRPGFEETIFLLLFGKLPDKQQLELFSSALSKLRELPEDFTEDMILKQKGKNIMNMLARCVLVLYTLDKNADDISVLNVLNQSLNLIAKFPTLIAYSYQARRYYYDCMNLSIRHPEDGLTTAENFLYMLKGHKRYTQLEAELLDLVLILHAEHGGGNNSTFAARVVSSSDTDTYSAISAALGSLKGPLHGGANQRVAEMMEDIKKNVKDWKDEKAVSEYLLKILKKEAFGTVGKIYGFGHAVYTLSDPRAVILKEKARELAAEKDRMDEFELFELVEKLAPKVFAEFKCTSKIISPNVDFYSGFVYDCLGIPSELYNPLFAMSRIASWCAHRIEEIVSSRKIIRPAYRWISETNNYKHLHERG